MEKDENAGGFVMRTAGKMADLAAVGGFILMGMWVLEFVRPLFK
jgi:hypothetical protein